MMELDDCAFPLLESMDASDDPMRLFLALSTHCSSGHGLADQGWNGKICSKPMRKFFRSGPGAQQSCCRFIAGPRCG